LLVVAVRKAVAQEKKRPPGWWQHQKLFNQRDEARRKPRAVGCAQYGAKEATWPKAARMECWSMIAS
jgi:hypothetical protein